MLNRLLRRVAIESGEFLSERAYFSALPRLETPDLILRTALRKDAEDVFCYAADPEVARYVLWDPHTSVGESRAYIRYLRRLYREGMPSSWMLELKRM